MINTEINQETIDLTVGKIEMPIEKFDMIPPTENCTYSNC